MTHTGPMPDSAGDFGEWEHLDNVQCRKCGEHYVVRRLWESKCGGFEDLQYRCQCCGATWWVEGPDS